MIEAYFQFFLLSYVVKHLCNLPFLDHMYYKCEQAAGGDKRGIQPL